MTKKIDRCLKISKNEWTNCSTWSVAGKVFVLNNVNHSSVVSQLVSSYYLHKIVLATGGPLYYSRKETWLGTNSVVLLDKMTYFEASKIIGFLV